MASSSSRLGTEGEGEVARVDGAGCAVGVRGADDERGRGLYDGGTLRFAEDAPVYRVSGSGIRVYE